MPHNRFSRPGPYSTITRFHLLAPPNNRNNGVAVYLFRCAHGSLLRSLWPQASTYKRKQSNVQFLLTQRRRAELILLSSTRSPPHSVSHAVIGGRSVHEYGPGGKGTSDITLPPSYMVIRRRQAGHCFNNGVVAYLRSVE